MRQMNWCSAAFALAVIVVPVTDFVAGPASAPAVASPETPTADQSPGDGADASCTYELTAPQLTILPGGGKAVTATLAPVACSGIATPSTSTVCVSAPDGTSNCATGIAWTLAKVVATASEFTGTFNATGNGCWKVAMKTGSEPACEPSGPLSLTL